MNKILLTEIKKNNNTITFYYKVDGEWSRVFKTDHFFVEYDFNIEEVPDCVAVIPFLSNIITMAWVCDASVEVPSCEKEFFDCLENVKSGYKKMHPSIDFGGRLKVDEIIQLKNSNPVKGTAAFFSGGVDAFNTLICHVNEHPMLITLLGADIALEDEEGSRTVENHLKETAERFGCNCAVVRTELKKFYRHDYMSEIVEKSGDNWWHGFQHGIGIIGHAAPIAYCFGLKNIYFASSFTASDKGHYTCASDPTIDNHIRFCESNIIHDGYEYRRQDKIHNIIDFSIKMNIDIPLRVCWESAGGSNCCRCEKCFRTMLAIFASKIDIHKMGFSCSQEEFFAQCLKMKYSQEITVSRYGPIWDELHNNWEREAIPKELMWLYEQERNKIHGKNTIVSFLNKVIRHVKWMLGKMKKKG